jgi:hypothetical protein
MRNRHADWIMPPPNPRIPGWRQPFLPALLPARVGSPAGVRKPARLVAQRLQATLGQSVIIENQAGAGGTIGTKQAAIAAPDGSMMALIGTFGAMRSSTSSTSIRKVNLRLSRRWCSRRAP